MAETRLPSIPAISESNLSGVARAIKQILDVREGLTGDPLDANITFRDLVDVGVVQVMPGRRGAGRTLVAPIGTEPDGYDPARDLTIPQRPEGVQVTGGFAVVIVQWDAPIYRNHAYAEVWRSDTNQIGGAVLIGTSQTLFYTDALGNSASSYYWVRFVSLANVTGPYNAVDGLLGETASNPGLLLDSLTGQITEGELYSGLASRIDLIDGPESLANSVSARIALESSARTQAIAAEADARSAAIALEAQQRTSAIQAEAAARVSQIDGATSVLQSQIDLLSAASAGDVGDLIAVVKSEEESRISADQAFATQNSLLFTINGVNAAAIKNEETARSFADSATASALNLLYVANEANSAAVLNEANVRVAADSSTASRLSALKATSDNGIAGLAVERQIRSDSLSSISSQTTALAAGLGGANAALLTSQSLQAARDAVTASQISGLVSSLGSSLGSIRGEQSIRLTETTALASLNSTLSAVVGVNSASIEFAQRSSVDRDAALSSQVTGLYSSFGDALSSIRLEQDTRTGVDSALSNQVASAVSRIGDASSAIVSQQNTSASQAQALATRVDGVNALLGLNNAAIQLEQSVRSAQDLSLANQSQGIFASAGSAISGLSVEQTVRAAADSSSAAQSSRLAALLAGNSAAITSESASRATQFGSLSSQITTAQATANGATAAVQQEISVRASETGSLFAKFGVKVDVGGFVAGYGLLSSGNAANQVAQSVNWSAVADGAFRAVTNKQPDRDKFYEVINGRVLGDTDNSGYMSVADAVNFSKFATGESLAASVYDYINITFRAILMADPIKYQEYLVTKNDGSVSSEFAVRADRFYVAPPAVVSSSAPSAGLYDGYAWVDTSASPSVTKYWNGSEWGTSPTRLPFIVQAKGESLNGTYVPPGVYIDTAFIRDGTITNAKIGNAAIDNAKIASLDAAKITTGFLSADRIQAGSLDAKIADIDAAVITSGIIDSARIGNLDAGKITTGQLTADRIDGLNLEVRAGQYTGYNWPESGGGFYIGPAGLLLGRYDASNPASTYFQFDVANGAIYANGFSIVGGNASFGGSLSAATGTFSGSLTADAVNAVNTINIAGNSVTVPVHAVSSGVVVSPSNVAWIDLQTAYVDPQGGAVSVVASAAISNGTDLSSFSYGAIRVLDPNGNEIGLVAGAGGACVCARSTLAGTYKLQGRRLASVYNAGFYYRSLLLIGSKR